MVNKLIAAGLMLVGTVAATVGGTIIYKVSKLSKKFDTSVKNMESITVKDIDDRIVEQAIRKASEEKVDGVVRAVKSEVMAEAHIQLTNEVRKAVKDAQKEIQDSVSEKISTEASLIDMDSLRKSARDKAEAKILDKFDGNLEDLLQKFNENLSNVQKIYGGIADAIGKTNKSSKEIKFSLD